ncbi:MAG: hypothetical protein OEV62_00140 [Actinomycetota bacterium]|nr:hypothetical protein [Actinomycetota bacterium]
MAVEVAQAYVSLVPSARGFAAKASKELEGPLADVGRSAGKDVSDAFVKNLDLGKGAGSRFAANLRDVDGHAGRAGGGASRSFVDKFTSGLGGIATGLAATFAAVQVGGFLKGAVDEASSLSESLSKVGAVFGDSADEIVGWSKTAATSLGQSQQQALEAAGTFGNLFRAMGLGEGVAAGMSTEIIGLATDLASFNNAEVDDVLLALRSGLVGETEPLRRFGVNLNDARIKAEAFRLGLVDSSVDVRKLSAAEEAADKAARKVAKTLEEKGEASVEYADAVRDAEQANAALAGVLDGKIPDTLDAATKAQAAYSLILADTSIAQGDFARTSDGLANQQRILAAQITDLKSRIGTALLPSVIAVVSALNRNLLPAFDRVSAVVGPLAARAADLGRAFIGALSGDGITSDGIFGIVETIGVAIRDLVILIGTSAGAFAAAFSGEGITSDGFVGVVETVAVEARNLIDTAVIAASAFAAAFSGEGITSDGFVGVVETVGVAARAVFDGISASIGFVIEHFDEITEAARTLAPSVVAAVAAFKGFTAVQSIVGQVSGALSLLGGGLLANPLGIAAAGAAGLAVALYTLYQRSETFRAAVQPALEVARDLFGALAEKVASFDIGAAFDAVRTAVTTMIDTVRPAFESIGEAVQPAIDAIVSLLPTVVDAGRQIIAALGTVDLGGFFGSLASSLSPVIDGLVNLGGAVATFVVAAIPPLVDLAQRVIPVLVAVLTTLITDVLPVVLTTFSGVAAVAGPVLGVALDVLAATIGFLADHLDVLVPLLAGAAGAFVAFKTASAVTTGIGNVTSAIGILQSTAQTFGVSFGRAALEATKQTGPISKLSAAFTNLKGSITGAAKGAASHAKAMAAQTKQIVIQIAQGVKAAAVWVAQKVALVATTIATKAAAAGQAILNAVMSANPVFFVVAAIAALAAGLVIAYKKSETFRNIVDAVGRALRDAFFKVAEFVTGTIVPAIVGFGRAVFNVLQPIAGFIFGTLIPALARFYAAYARFVLGILKAVGSFIVGTVLPILGKIGSFLLDVVVEAVKKFASIASAAFDVFATVIKAVAGFIVDTLVPAFAAVAGFIIDKLVPAAVAIVEWFGDHVVGAIKAVVGFVLDVLVPAFKAYWSFIAEKVIPILADIVTWLVDHVVAAFKDAVSFLVDRVIPALSDLWAFIRDKVIPIFGDVVGAIRDFVTGALDRIGELVSTAKDKVDTFVGFFTGLKNRLSGAFVGMFDGLWEAFKGAVNLIIRGWNSLDFSLPSIDTGIPGVGKIGGVTIRVPQIPELADGGYISAPTLALVGEGSQPEIVSPVSKMRDVVRSELDRAGNATPIFIDKFVTQEPPRTMFEELQWRVAAGVL